MVGMDSTPKADTAFSCRAPGQGENRPRPDWVRLTSWKILQNLISGLRCVLLSFGPSGASALGKIRFSACVTNQLENGMK